MAQNELGLSKDDVEVIKKTWEPVSKDMSGVGNILFKVMFQMFPDYSTLFTRFKTPEEPDVFKNPRFQEHVTGKVMTSFGKIILLIENPEELNSLLTTIGKNHAKRKVTKRHFENLTLVVMETLRRGLGHQFTPEAEEAWGKLLRLGMSAMGEASELEMSE